MKKNKYELMGKIVTVTKVWKRVEEEQVINNCKEMVITWKPIDLAESRDGWVVGYRWLSNGVYDPGRPAYDGSYFSAGDDYEQPFLAVTKKVPCLLVAWWPTMKPIQIPMDGWRKPDELAQGMIYDRLYNNAGYGEGKSRRDALAYQSKQCRDFPFDRDERGRFKK